MFRIRDILRRIRILGSVHWITEKNPDLGPALFVSGSNEAKKFFLRFFAYYLPYCGYGTVPVHNRQSSKITNHNEDTKQLK
jgi:hypothetical protein